jgi:hypothetical protein
LYPHAKATPPHIALSPIHAENKGRQLGPASSLGEETPKEGVVLKATFVPEIGQTAGQAAKPWPSGQTIADQWDRGTARHRLGSPTLGYLTPGAAAAFQKERLI